MNPALHAGHPAFHAGLLSVVPTGLGGSDSSRIGQGTWSFFRRGVDFFVGRGLEGVSIENKYHQAGVGQKSPEREARMKPAIFIVVLLVAAGCRQHPEAVVSNENAYSEKQGSATVPAVEPMSAESSDSQSMETVNPVDASVTTKRAPGKTSPAASKASQVVTASDEQHDHGHGSAKSDGKTYKADPATGILDPNSFSGMEVRDTYAKARLVADRLDQMYCYCRCHENDGLKHKSLLTCFQSDHAAECGICLAEGKQAWLDWKDGMPVEMTIKTVDIMYNAGNPAPTMPN